MWVNIPYMEHLGYEPSLSNSHQKKHAILFLSLRSFFASLQSSSPNPFRFLVVFFFDTLSPIIMVQWRMAVFKRYNYFWRHTHSSRNHDHLDLLIRWLEKIAKQIPTKWCFDISMVIYHGTKSQTHTKNRHPRWWEVFNPLEQWKQPFFNEIRDCLDRDPYIGLWNIPQQKNWVGFHPLKIPKTTNQGPLFSLLTYPP